MLKADRCTAHMFGGQQLQEHTSGHQTAHWECTQALAMAETLTRSRGPRPRLVAASGVSSKLRCRLTSPKSPTSCSLWHSAHLRPSDRRLSKRFGIGGCDVFRHYVGNTNR